MGRCKLIEPMFVSWKLSSPQSKRNTIKEALILERSRPSLAAAALCGGAEYKIKALCLCK